MFGTFTRVRQIRSSSLLLIVAALSGGGCAMRAGEATSSSDGELRSCASGTTLKGVDVSSYQGSIDWNAARADGISFAFVKATEGESWVDSTFAGNWADLKAAGIVRGAYHFFHPNVSATAQADHVLSTVGTLDADDLPIVLDFEVLDGVSESSAVADAVTFLETVSNATGKTAILYMSSGFLGRSYPSLAPYPLWVANYGVSCPGLPSEWGHWSFWQDNDNGNVNGIPSGGVDTDVFNGPLSALMALTGGGGGGGSSGGSGGGSSGGGSSGGSGGGSSSGGSTSCTLAGKTYAENTCTETQQCDSGSWVSRTSDPSSCNTGIEPKGACVTDFGSVVPQNTCTSSLQCDDGVWVSRYSDPAACL